MGLLRSFAYVFYWRMERLIVPGLRNSQYDYMDKVQLLVPPDANWLDIGCGHNILASWISDSAAAEKALIDRTKITIGTDFSYQSLCRHRSIKQLAVADIAHMPFQHNTFDLISANMVMEHIQNPKAALAEIARILKPGGLFIFHTVNYRNYTFRAASLVPQALKNRLVWLLEGRAEEDVFPTAYRFNTRKQILDESLNCGLNIREISFLNSTPATALLGPLAIPELLLTKALQREAASDYRSNIIGVVQKAEPRLQPFCGTEATLAVG